LLGFDDIPMVEFFKVPITVITQDPYKIGKEATQLLLGNIHDKKRLPQKIMIPCTLSKRLSCKKR
jgi:DNA-binding LacI/PurR family transcriptional regulator